MKLAGWDVPFGTTEEKYSDDRAFLIGVSLLTLLPLAAIFGWLGLLYMIIFYTLVLVIGASIHKYWKGETEKKDENLLDD